jgi:hypothetical protein
MATSPEQLINQALRRIGYTIEIGYLYEGSPAARAALTLYGQTRDDLLCNIDWPFARQSVQMTLLKTAPPGGYSYPTLWTSAFPPIPWIFEYAYPTGCLEMRAVRPVAVLIPEYDPVPNIFAVADDPSLPSPSKVVLSNLSNAIAVFTGQITDPTQWEPMFTEALVEAMARRMGEAMGAGEESIKMQLQIEAEAAAQANRARG